MKNDERTFIALDLGTSNILAYIEKHGIVFNEPSIMAYELFTNTLLALGQAAYELRGKTSDNVEMIVPIKDGVITDLEATKDLLKHIFSKIKFLNEWKNSIVLLACPSSITEIEKNALKQVAFDMKAEIVIVEEEVKMAALGAGINIELAKGNIVVDIGGGTTDVALISAGSIIISKSIKLAGNALDEEVKKYIKSEYNVLIGSKTAEKVKIELGSLSKLKSEKTMSVFGRDVVSGLPREALVSSEEIRGVFINTFSGITNTVIEIMEQTPPELAGDIILNGFTLCGGGALIKGIKEYFNEVFSIKCSISQNPLTGVVDGAKEYYKALLNRIEKDYYGKNALLLKRESQYL